MCVGVVAEMLHCNPDIMCVGVVAEMLHCNPDIVCVGVVAVMLHCNRDMYTASVYLFSIMSTLGFMVLLCVYVCI